MPETIGSRDKKEKAGAVWVIGVSAPAVVTGICLKDESTGARSYSAIKKIFNKRNRPL